MNTAHKILIRIAIPTAFVAAAALVACGAFEGPATQAPTQRVPCGDGAWCIYGERCVAGGKCAPVDPWPYSHARGDAGAK